MQGGIRRKKDLLPRYNGGRRGARLTTPMKKTLIYLAVLSTLFLMFRFGYSDLNREVAYELDHSTPQPVEVPSASPAPATASGPADPEDGLLLRTLT